MRYLARKSLQYVRGGGALGLGAKTVSYVRLQAAALAAVPVLKHRARDVRTAEDAFDFVQTFRFGGVQISALQRRVEIEGLLAVLAQERPRTLLEIGTAEGGTLFMFTRVAADDALIVSIDLRGGEFGGGYALSRVPLYRAFARARQRIRLIRANSHDPSTLARARHVLGGRSLDFLFVDGDHRYEGVSRDYQLYAPLVRPGGLIAFHDIAPGAIGVAGSAQLWAELDAANPGRTRMLLKDPHQRVMGIGLLRVAE